jgi:predicted enzyme related to lactoylglutathione lyase
VLMEPDDVGDSGRMAVCADPAGASFCLWQAKAHRGAAIVNEPGSLNFNDLHTRDIEGASAFYGAVFGWELLGAGGFSMWALPGYGDLLEERNPGTRENMAAMGAPERFEDVVASLNPIPDDQPDTPAHWGVTFAVDDADAIAARAAQLGGRVVVPPFDAPWVRMTSSATPRAPPSRPASSCPRTRTSRRAPAPRPAADGRAGDPEIAPQDGAVRVAPRSVADSRAVHAMSPGRSPGLSPRHPDGDQELLR